MLRVDKYLALLVCTVCSSAVANEPSNWHWNGFFSQGFVYARDNNFFVNDQDSSWAHSEIGLNGSYALNNATRFNGQIIYRHVGDQQEEGLRLDYGFVDRYIWSNELISISAKAGRIKSQFGLYGDSLSAPFTRSGIFTAQSTYPDLFRDFLVSYDGLEWMNTLQLPHGQLAVTLWGGLVAAADDRTVANAFGEFARGDLESERPLTAAHIKYDAGAWALGTSYMYGPLEFSADADSAIASGDIGTHDFRVFAQYNLEYWELTAEYLEQIFKVSGMANRQLPPGLLPEKQRFEPQGYYLQLRHFVTPSVTLLLRYDEFYSDKTDHDGEDSAAKTELLAGLLSDPALAQRPDMFYTKSWTLGVSWEPNSNWLLRMEYHDVRGSARSFAQFAPNSLVNDEKDWSIFALQASYRF